jgi:hypothetical protein
LPTPYVQNSYRDSRWMSEIAVEHALNRTG